MAYDSELSHKQLKALAEDFDAMGKDLNELPAGGVRKNGHYWQAILRYTKTDPAAPKGKRQVSLTHKLDAKCDGRGAKSKAAAGRMLATWRAQVIEDAKSARGFQADPTQSVINLMRAYIRNLEESQTIAHVTASNKYARAKCVEGYAFSSLPVNNVTRQMIQDMVNDMTTARAFAGGTVRHVVGDLKQLFTAVLGDRPNPCDGLLLPPMDANQKRQTSTKGVIVLDEDGISRTNALLDALDATSPTKVSRTAMAARLALTCGLRIEECAGLRWRDVDLDEDAPRIHVRNTLVYTTIPTTDEEGNPTRKYEVYDSKPKTKSSVRDIRLPDSMAKRLRSYRAQFQEALLAIENAPKLDDLHVLDRLSDFTPSCPRILSNDWSHYAKRHDITDEHGRLITIHCLRHTYGSVMAKKHGLAVASRLLGHSNVAITAQYYTGATTDELDRAVSETGDVLTKTADNEVIEFKPTGTED